MILDGPQYIKLVGLVGYDWSFLVWFVFFQETKKDVGLFAIWWWLWQRSGLHILNDLLLSAMFSS